MSDQNTTPERIWIKPCDPCENPYDYYVCEPLYLNGRETSYVKSVVSCAGCGGGLKRHSGQFICRDCGKAETVQEVLARADRAAPTDNTALVEAEKRGMQKVLSHFRECAEHDQGGLDYSSLVGIPICNADELASEVAFYERAARHVQDVLDRAALASREAPLACQQEAEDVTDAQASLAKFQRNGGKPLPQIAAELGEPVTLAEAGMAALKELANTQMNISLTDWQRISSAIYTALRALKGER